MLASAHWRVIASGVAPTERGDARESTGAELQKEGVGAGPGEPAAPQLPRARPGVTVLEVRLHTGRRNQIRLHCQLEGLPLIGERQYVEVGTRPRGPALKRQALHALRLGLRHPRSGAKLSFSAPLPADLATLLQRPKSKRKALSEPSEQPTKRPPTPAAAPALAIAPAEPTDGAPDVAAPQPPKKVRLKPRRAKKDTPAKLVKKAKRAKQRPPRRRAQQNDSAE